MFSKNFLLNLWVGSEILLTMMGCDKKTPYQQKFYYGDSVKVISGFYKNVIGKVVDCSIWENGNDYYITFENRTIQVNEKLLVKIP